MRRKDREVISINEIVQIIDKCDVCRVAFSDNDIPYIVPMNFGYHFSDEGLVLYFHCAREGKKLDIINKNANVCFEMDCSHNLVTGNLACDYTMEYESVIGNGRICFITDQMEKLNTLNFIMRKYSNNNEIKNNEFKYNDKHLKNVICLKLMATEFSGKCSK